MHDYTLLKRRQPYIDPDTDYEGLMVSLNSSNGLSSLLIRLFLVLCRAVACARNSEIFTANALPHTGFGDKNQKTWHEGVRRLHDRQDVDALNDDRIRWYRGSPDAINCVPEPLRRWHWWREGSFPMNSGAGGWRPDDWESSRWPGQPVFPDSGPSA